MSNLTPTRATLLMCVVPAVIALISVYWIRKKKKFKKDCQPTALDSEDICCENVDSLTDSSLYSADTLSDASSFASPESSEKSQRTKNFIHESITNSVTTNSFTSSSNSRLNLFKESPPRCISNDFQTHNGTKPTLSDGDKPKIESLLNRSEEKDNLMSAFQFGGFGDVDDHGLSNKVDDDATTHEIFSRLLKTPNFNSGSLNPMEELEKMLGFSPKIVENGISHENESNGSPSSPLEIMESVKLQSLETESNDSHSSVLDENSLSYVSDDSDRQAVERKTKGSLLSDLDESMCDELDKSCSPILAESKLQTFSSKEKSAGDKVEEPSNFEQVPTETSEVQSPNSSHLGDTVLNRSTLAPEADSSLCSSTAQSVDSPPEPNISGRTEGFRAEIQASCDSPAVESSKSSLSPEDAPMDPSPDPTPKLTNGEGAKTSLQNENCNSDENPQIPEMDIAERLGFKSTLSVTAMENENCSESSGWEMPDSQCDVSIYVI